ncbi:MAG: 3-deoxy-D-manno-octulosonic acid transferase [Minwuia sp.]|nr:3-deoxy-D-manno-octulosonic acid transferase [Minwuia sp.]
MDGAILYHGLGTVLTPLAPLLLRRRLRAGKEDPARLGERLGQPGRRRPQGLLIWIHAASVGESQSVLALIGRLREKRPDIAILVTTGTVTSAELISRHLPDGAFHQFVPLDLPGPTRRFMEHWKPDAAFWVESELWPGLIRAMHSTGKPLVLLNGRMSARSFRRWRRLRPVIAGLLGCFTKVLTQGAEYTDRFRVLGARNVVEAGNLKHAAEPLSADPGELTRLQALIGNRPVWLAASVHPGEELTLLAAQQRIAATVPDALLIIVPRHPARADEMLHPFTAQGIGTGFRSAGQDPTPDTAVHVADTMGELGLFYRLAQVAVIGGSFIPHGGQNLLEAARLGCVPICGPHMDNFREIADEMSTSGAMIPVQNADGLSSALLDLLQSPDGRARAKAQCRAVTGIHDDVLDQVMAEISPHLPHGEWT